MVWEMGNRGSERACDWPEVSQRNLAWTQHVSPQNCCPLQGGASASLSHMPVASLAMKVIGRKLGFGKRVETDCWLHPRGGIKGSPRLFVGGVSGAESRLHTLGGGSRTRSVLAAFLSGWNHGLSSTSTP